MKLFRHLSTVVCVVASFAAKAGAQLTPDTKGATNQPADAELQLLQGTWEGVDGGDQQTPKNPDSQEISKRKPGEIDLDFLKSGVSETPSQPQGKITITIKGNAFHFHRDTNFWFDTTITLPAGTDPKQLHATIKDCPTASSIGEVVVAIFKIEDGILTLATGNGDGEAPMSFEATGLNRYELRKIQPSLGPKPVAPWENSLGMKFVPVPGTSVLFCIWETRVQDYEAFVKATSHNAGEAWRDPGYMTRGFNADSDAAFSQTPLHPVTHVNWNDAEAFCRWLTEKERAAGRLPAGQEFRLPTDDEWSRAVGLPAESGATPEDKDGKIANVYPWGAGYPPPKGSGNYLGEGDDWGGSMPGKIDGYADGAKFTAKVGSYTANRLGIYDLGGNVWEWCSDWHNAEQKARVIRGASFVQGGPGVLLSSCHTGQPPGVRDRRFGFRCVVTVGASPP